MNHVKHPSNNVLLGAPEGWDQERLVCVGLPATRGNSAGLLTVSSFWTPDEEERVRINEGGLIEVSLIGQTHAPISLRVVDDTPASTSPELLVEDKDRGIDLKKVDFVEYAHELFTALETLRTEIESAAKEYGPHWEEDFKNDFPKLLTALQRANFLVGRKL